MYMNKSKSYKHCMAIINANERDTVYAKSFEWEKFVDFVDDPSTTKLFLRNLFYTSMFANPMNFSRHVTNNCFFFQYSYCITIM